MSIEIEEPVSRRRYRGGWHGPHIDLKSRLYIIDAIAPPIVGTNMLVHGVPHAGNHRCVRNGSRACSCFYAMFLVARTRRHVEDLGQVALRGFLTEEVQLPKGSGRAEVLILPANTPLIGELFVHEGERPKGWLAPPRP